MRRAQADLLATATRRRAFGLSPVAVRLVVAVGCMLVASTAVLAQSATADSGDPAPEIELLSLIPPELEHLEGSVASQLGEALQLLESIRLQPGTPRGELAEAFGATGRLYHAYDLSEPAAVCYENASRLAPEDFRWLYSLAYLDQKAGRFERAISGFERALELVPGSLPAWVRLGDAYLSDGRLEQARASLGKALELDPGSAAARAILGQVALSEKQYASAVEHLKAALEAVPVANRLHHPLGLAYRGLGDMDRARHHLASRGGVGVQPPDPLIESLAELKVGERVFLLRGQLAFRNGMYGPAIEAFRAALAAEPDSVRARVNLGSALAENGQREEAVTIYEEVLKLSPENKTAYFNLGVLLRQSGDQVRAAKALEAAARLDPQDAPARIQLASALVRLQRWDDALSYAREAKDLDPAHEGARVLEAQILQRQGQHAAARASIEQAHDVMPEAGTVAVVLAKMLAAGPDLSLRDGARAVDLAQRIYQAIPNVQHAELMAMALAEAGRCDEAAELQRQALGAARMASATELAERLAATLEHLDRRPCRMPGSAGTPAEEAARE